MGEGDCGRILLHAAVFDPLTQGWQHPSLPAPADPLSCGLSYQAPSTSYNHAARAIMSAASQPQQQAPTEFDVQCVERLPDGQQWYTGIGIDPEAPDSL